jgi:hypothetical protein
MKIISFDVGIVNLAYCIFEIKDNNYSIIDWNVINLCNENNRICRYSDNKGSCKKNATYFKDNMYYCKRHANKDKDFIIPDINININKIKKLKVKELHDFCDKHKVDIPNKSNKETIIELIDSFINKNFYSILQPIKASNMDLICIGRNIQILLDKYLQDHLSTITHVIIENQISPIANRMKSIQGMLTQYFIMKTVSIIEYISSENKLKHLNLDKSKLTYSDRKKKAIEECKHILQDTNNNNKWCDFFNNHKKKDDLSDCCLQGLWYLHKYIIIRKT